MNWFLEQNFRVLSLYGEIWPSGKLVSEIPRKSLEIHCMCVYIYDHSMCVYIITSCKPKHNVKKIQLFHLTHELFTLNFQQLLLLSSEDCFDSVWRRWPCWPLVDVKIGSYTRDNRWQPSLCWVMAGWSSLKKWCEKKKKKKIPEKKKCCENKTTRVENSLYHRPQLRLNKERLSNRLWVSCPAVPFIRSDLA